VGVEGRAELAEFTLSDPVPAGFVDALQEALPEGFTVLGFEPYRASRSVAARVVGAKYRVIVTTAGPLVASVLQEAARLYTCASGIMVDRRRPEGTRQVDVRAFVQHVSAVAHGDTAVIGFSAAVTPSGTARPEEVVAALSRLGGLPLEIRSVERLSLELD